MRADGLYPWKRWHFTTHEHRWSATMVQGRLDEVWWRACSCGARKEYGPDGRLTEANNERLEGHS